MLEIGLAIVAATLVVGGCGSGSSTSSPHTPPPVATTPSIIAPTPSPTPTERISPIEPTEVQSTYDGPTPSPTPLAGTGAAGSGAATGSAVTCPHATSTVTDAAGLTDALTSAKPGSVIDLADGTYGGQFVATASGRRSEPIWLCGGSGAVLDGGDLKDGYTLHVDHADYWRLVGFSVRDGQKGVVVDGSTGIVIQGLTVSDIGDEGIHLRSGTTYSIVRGNTVSATGLYKDKFGEGIYVGSANSNWCTYSMCGPDRSNFDSIVANTISDTGAESIDIKEGTQNGLISDNHFDGSRGLTGADSWVDVKGNDWLIEDNTGVDSPEDGFQVHELVDGWGNDNVFQQNTADVNGPGYGFHITPTQQNVVYCNNKAVDADLGLTNVICKS